MIEPVIPVVPRRVLDAHVVVRTGIDLQPGILVVVKPVVLDAVPGAAVELDAVGGPRRGSGVEIRLVVADHGSGDAAAEVDPVIVGPKHRVAGDMNDEIQKQGEASHADEDFHPDPGLEAAQS